MPGGYKVTLLVFSGRPDPVFPISAEHDKFPDVKTHLEKAKAKLDLTPALASKLGYKGFLVHHKEENQHHHIAHGKTAPLQKLLLQIALVSKQITQDLHDAIWKSIEADEVGTFVTKVAAGHEVGFVDKNPGPPLDLAKWNDKTFVQLNNNCYNYSTDNMTCTFAQPGEGTGHKYTAILPNEILGSAAFDHVKMINPQPAPDQPAPLPSNEQWLVALVVSTATGLEDFHWYRLDSNGYWSQKPGQGKATNKDGNGQLITDPRKAANFIIPYKFVAFMYSKPTLPIM